MRWLEPQWWILQCSISTNQRRNCQQKAHYEIGRKKYNFGCYSVQKLIPAESVEDLVKWGKEKLSYLFNRQTIPRSQSISKQSRNESLHHHKSYLHLEEIQFRTSCELMGDSIVHIHAKLLCLISSRSMYGHVCSTGLVDVFVPCAVALLADCKEIDIHLHLWVFHHGLSHTQMNTCVCADCADWVEQLLSGTGSWVVAWGRCGNWCIWLLSTKEHRHRIVSSHQRWL